MENCNESLHKDSWVLGQRFQSACSSIQNPSYFKQIRTLKWIIIALSMWIPDQQKKMFQQNVQSPSTTGSSSSLSVLLSLSGSLSDKSLDMRGPCCFCSSTCTKYAARPSSCSRAVRCRAQQLITRSSQYFRDLSSTGSIRHNEIGLHL